MNLTNRLKKKHLATQFFMFLTTYLKAQCIATLIAFPFLVQWGLAFSLFSWVGNLIFMPFLTLFLLLSSLVYFTELLCIPNGLLITMLTLLSNGWQTLLKCGKKEWLFGFARPHPILFIILTIGTFSILYLLQRRKLFSLKALAYLLLANCTVSYCYPFVQKAWEIKRKNFIIYKKLIICQNHTGKIEITDNGFFRRKKNVASAINFEIRPYLLQTYGTTHVVTLLLNVAAAQGFCAALELCKTCRVDKVVLPYFERQLSRYDWFCFFRLKECLEMKGIPFIRQKAHMQVAQK